MSNTDIILKMYEYFGTGDLDKIKSEVFHPEIIWRMPGHHPLSATMKGADDVMAFFGDLFKAGITVDDVHFGELDNGTVVEKHHGHGTAEGVEYLFRPAPRTRSRTGRSRTFRYTRPTSTASTGTCGRASSCAAWRAD